MNIVGIVLCFVGSMIFIIVLECCLPSNSFKLLGISLKCLEKREMKTKVICTLFYKNSEPQI